MASVRLFVYGSLKRGGRHHDELEGATFVGEATTLPGYRLVALGEYLALVGPIGPIGPIAPAPEAAAEAASVAGELYETTETKLSALDAFEGDAYQRGNVPLQKFGFALAYFKKAD
jgi:gamma-glutamylcyclotransferase (GGCT)/AIG2-like uncharacterized protein YtfP